MFSENENKRTDFHVTYTEKRLRLFSVGNWCILYTVRDQPTIFG